MFALIGLALFVVIIQIAGSSSRSYFEEKIRNGTVTREDIKKMSHHYSSSGWGNWSTIEKADEVISEREYKKEIEYRKSDEYKLKASDEITRWEKENPFLMNADLELEGKLISLGNSTPRCNKCGNDEMRIWGIKASNITIRCGGCKKKFEYPKEFYSESSIKINGLKQIQELIPLYEQRMASSLSDNIYWRATKNLEDLEGIIKSHPGTYKFLINCSAEPIYSKRRKPGTSIESEDERSRRISQEVKDSVWNRDGGKCVECGSNENLEFDHIIPWSKGGANTYRNLQLLCESCNRSKSDKIG